ncbi:hypothetical protein DPX16_8785 [Anabarilius grahami]|uniref:Uncharacterized protein n=1 Tax=Anabarilius grahami TaxID=495550 RepID=A0A3N0YDR3_ANAGA|nr:hypothetical protein DPX16_8785 [Anabarilius grahami]
MTVAQTPETERNDERGEFSKEMIFALKEKDSDEIPFSADLYRQSALPDLAG